MNRKPFSVIRRASVSRRTFLRGTGALLALPFLDAMVPALARAGENPLANAPRRLVFVFAPNGVHIPDWTPKKTGKDFELPHLLESLAPVRKHIQVLSNLDMDNARAHGDGPGDHARAAACFLTGAHPVKTAGKGLRTGISVDQVAAKAIGRKTRFASLELGTERGRAAGACDSGYACAYSNNISWRTPETPNAKEVDPRLVFERLFGSPGERESEEAREAKRKRRVSVLDVVRKDARRLSKNLGASDRDKLDEYLTGVRELEVRLARVEEAPEVDPTHGFKSPKEFPRDVRGHIRLLNDLIVLAFRADLTRVATLMLGNAGSNRAYRQLGVTEGHHHLSHHGGKEGMIAKIKKINRFHVEEFAHLIQGLAGVAEGEHKLIDQSMVVFGSAIADGNRHDHHRVPMLLAGGGGGTLEPGRHVQFKRGTPATNLYLALLDRMGVRVRTLGDSTGHLAGI